MERTTTCRTGGRRNSEHLDRVCSLLSDGRRRRLLRTLIDHDDDAIELAELASKLARDGRESPDTIAVELHHSHLPKASKAGVLDYDRRTRWIRYRGDEIVDAILRG